VVRVDVEPEMLRWAWERAGYDLDGLAARIPQLSSWYHGEKRPTLKQIEDFAKATHAPVGYLFLSEPPVERIPIPDLRTMDGGRIDQPSPDLLDTLYLCQQRQEWYRDYARTIGETPLSFVSSATPATDVEAVAGDLRRALGFDLDERRRAPTWTDALRSFIEQADSLGVLVMISGIVGNNTHRRLDPEEFRGFALSDDLAPLVFINGADTKAAQMFTLAHELAHLWLGESALSDVSPLSSPPYAVEAWCNRVAAELLVPLAALRESYRPAAELRQELDRLARVFKVSTLVVLRRIHDVGGLSRDQLRTA
jgi:Zn-dependent peptidase ImmA (M78 family)